MKKDIPFSKLIGLLSESRFFHQTSHNEDTCKYLYIPTGKHVDIPVRQYYSKDFLRDTLTHSGALDMSFALLWLYLEAL